MPDRFDAQPARNARSAPIRPDLRGPPGSLPGSGPHGRSRPLLLAGIGAALAFPATVSGSLRAVPPHQLGIASGVSATLQQLGGVSAIAAVTAIFTSTGGYQTPATFVHGLRPALLAIAAVALAPFSARG